MPRSGNWSQQIVFKNCGKPTCQQGCSLNSATKPHGPYAQLRRRNPVEIGQQDTVYLGKEPLTEEQLQIVNEMFQGPLVPKKTDVFRVLDEMIASKI